MRVCALSILAILGCSAPQGSYRPPPDWFVERHATYVSAPRPSSVSRQESAVVGLTDAQRRRNVWWLNAGGAAGITLYGLVFWDWGSSSFDLGDEGYLQDDSKYGGADKLGHVWSAYALTAASASLYRRWGYDTDRAALYASGTSLMITTLIEVGDGLSREFGFSKEDLAANVVGVGFEYLRQIYPPLARRVMYRWEWTPSEVFWAGEADPSTDYSGARYLLAFPLRGWGATGRPWRWLELQAGVYAEGYADAAPFFDQSRAVFVGIGLNLTAVLEDSFDSSAWHVFDYFQLPGISLRQEWVEEFD